MSAPSPAQPHDPAAPPVPRDAASLILIRRDGVEPQVLMGQRGAAARFMPSKFVFPGGAVDPADRAAIAAAPLPADCARRLTDRAPADLGRALALAAVRETFEETGLALAAPDPSAVARAAEAPPPWRPFLARGLRPALDRLTFIFRAITPPTRPVRFDARFFLADAAALHGDPDDFSGAQDELSHLSWLTLAQARRLDLPFITHVVLAEVEARLGRPDPGADRRPAPWFHHADGRSYIDSLP
jgi:8-oxo-dGTP pyrophosphatase MutT (NUDIX family)